MSKIEKSEDIGLIENSSIAPIDMEEISTTDPMNILKDKGRGISPGNLIIREAEYDTVRTRTVLPLNQIKTFERDMKRRRIVRITKTPGEHDGFRLNPD